MAEERERVGGPPEGSPELETGVIVELPEGESAAQVAAEVEADLASLEVGAPLVGIVVEAKDDLGVMAAAERELTDHGISSETRVMSAQEDAGQVADYASNARVRGLRVIIGGAGRPPALPGLLAAHCELPVIGVPLGSLGGESRDLSGLLSAAPAPDAAPVAWMTPGNARGAALLAVRILGG